MKITDAEHDSRCEQLAEHIRGRGLTGAVLFDNAYVLYYTGFAFIPTERPAAVVISAEGERGMFVPRLEREHAQANALVQYVADYPEYPSAEHPMRAFVRLLEQMRLSDQPLGSDHDGYPWIFGYRGPSLTELTGRTPEKITAFIEDALAIKSPAEIELIRESSKWG